MEEEPVEAPTLDALVEIRMPEPVSNAPATTAWTVLFLVLALIVGLAAWLAWRRWRRNAYRRAALAGLDAMVGSGRIRELPTLVKRVALEAWPREQVAGLTGDRWLRFLDASYGGTGFTAGPGRDLPGLAYGDAAGSNGTHDDLVALVRTWIRTHRARQGA